jgi:hypothetical protein
MLTRSASASGRAYVARDLQNQLAELHEPCGGERTAFEYGERYVAARGREPASRKRFGALTRHSASRIGFEQKLERGAPVVMGVVTPENRADKS